MREGSISAVRFFFVDRRRDNLMDGGISTECFEPCAHSHARGAWVHSKRRAGVETVRGSGNGAREGAREERAGTGVGNIDGRGWMR